MLIKQIIYQSERSGTADIVPHNALLKGQLIKRITVKDKDRHRDIILNLHSNVTVWEMKKRIGEQMDLIPKYLKLEKGQGYNATPVKDTDNGKTLKEFGICNKDFFTARRLELEEINEEIDFAPILNDENQFTEQTSKIFNDWFTSYADDNDQMNRDGCGLFIRGVTSEPPKMYDDRVDTLFKAHDKNKDGLIERGEFLEFYRSAS
jgi:Ca2+-binding EF-hand superfamily protein